jgi:glycine oxidase ThiO
VRTWDAIIIGGGIIGLSLAISLRKQGLRVLIVERGEPGREASHAAAGMLAGSGSEIPPPLRAFAEESARLYPEFIHELEDESGISVDLREHGTILFSEDGKFPEKAERVPLNDLGSLEPEIVLSRRTQAAFLSERSVDPRALTAAAIKTAKHRSVDISSGTEVKGVLVEHHRVTGVESDKTSYPAPIVVNCAGAWAGCVGPVRFPVKPIKGQMLAVVGGPAIKHVLRSEKVYLVPRHDGRIVIGSTLENAGYNKQTNVETIQQLLHAAVELVPALSGARQHEAWAGLRPGTPDELPILGETPVKGYFAATGHYRDGILLAPVTAQAMTDLVLAKSGDHDLASFIPPRFS